MRVNILPFVFLSSTAALVRGATILDALSQIANATIALNNTVASWSGDLLGALPIVVLSTELLLDINDGTNTAKASANLTLEETISVATATESLVTDVESVLTTIESAKSKFDNLLLGPVILLNLNLEKEATDEFSAAVIAKVPAAYQALAAALVAPIDTAFETAIADYQGAI